MSVQVLKIRFPGLLVAISVEQPHRRALPRKRGATMWPNDFPLWQG